MQTWIIEPRDPLIVRDGRPFGPNPGARATSLPFPTPSTITGGLRGRAGLTAEGHFDRERIAEVRAIGVRGPLLVELDAADEIAQWLPPAPADALLLEDDQRAAVRRRLAPLAVPAGAHHNLPAGLAPIGPHPYEPRKPLRAPPRYWHWEAYAAWLQALEDGPVDLKQLGIAGPQPERRTHVRITPESQTAMEGFLFQTGGLEFSAEGRRLAIGLVSAKALDTFTGGLAPLGGERRLMSWRPSSQSLPACTDSLVEAIASARHCRVILLTPAVFAAGYRPAWLLEPAEGVTPRLRAALVPRPQIISGWDMAAERKNKRDQTIYGAPKPTRRLAPAGSVFFLELDGDTEAVRRWVLEYWMQSVSDAEQDRRDGFGLIALGTWSGELLPLEVAHA